MSTCLQVGNALKIFLRGMRRVHGWLIITGNRCRDVRRCTMTQRVARRMRNKNNWREPPFVGACIQRLGLLTAIGFYIARMSGARPALTVYRALLRAGRSYPVRCCVWRVSNPWQWTGSLCRAHASNDCDASKLPRHLHCRTTTSSSTSFAKLAQSSGTMQGSVRPLRRLLWRRYVMGRRAHEE